MSDETKRPAKTIRDGNIKAPIWENEKDGRTMFSAKLQRVYTDRDGETRETDTFGRNDLLRVAYVAGRANDWINERTQELRKEMRESAKSARSRSRNRERDQGYER